MQSNKSPSGTSNAKPVYLTSKDQGQFSQTCMTDSERDHKPHVGSDTLYAYLTPEKTNVRMTHCWSCKESPVDNYQNLKPQSSHIISSGHHPKKLHVTQKGQKVNIQIDSKKG